MENTQRWVNIGLLASVGILFLFMSRLFEVLWDLLRLPIPPDSVIAPYQLVGIVIAAGIGIFVRRSGKMNGFFNEVALELSRVTWPKRKETAASTGVVIVLVSIAAAILFLLDALWGTVARGLL